MTPAKASPELMPKTPMATAMASSKLLPAAVKERAAVSEMRGECAVEPLREEGVPQYPVDALARVGSAAFVFVAVAVAATVPVSCVTARVAFAKARPGSLNWAAATGDRYLAFLEVPQRA